MSVGIVIPYSGSDGHRRTAFAYVHAYWTRFLDLIDGEIVTPATDPFSHARSRNLGVDSTLGDPILMVDADSFVPHMKALDAVRLAAKEDGLVVPFNRYVRLGRDATLDVYREFMPGMQGEAIFNSVGGVTAFSRATFDAVAGYDPRFGRWGGDDACFALATSTLVAPMRRLDGPCWHLYHDPLPESVPGDRGYVSQFAIVGQYRDAAGDVEAMRRLIGSRS